MKKKEAEINLGWANRDITPAQFESIKHLTGFVYKNGMRKNKIKVVMTEWASARFLVSVVSIVDAELKL